MSLPGHLGRIRDHDPMSKLYPARRATKLQTVMHVRHAPAWDQNGIGACCGFAMAGALMTEPFWKQTRRLDAVQARILYGTATELDGLPGTYPDEDNGTTALGVAR